MRRFYRVQDRRVHIYYRMIVLFCCGVFFLAGCGSPQEVTPTSAAPVKRATPVVKAMPVKSDVYGIASEGTSRAQLARVQQIISGMTLEQKLGQLIVVEYLGNDYQGSGLQEMIVDQHVGGFMYQEANHNFNPPYDSVSNVKALSQRIIKEATIPPLIATDQEGGLVNRLYRFHGALPSAADIAATGEPRVALGQGAQAARWMTEMGINTDLAPVVDVQTVDPPVLGSRMFGRDPQTVTEYAGAFLIGLQQNGVAGCLKHFPGLGAVTSDPHTGLPTVERSLEDLQQIDLAPYMALIKQNPPAMIMATDVLMPAIDPDLPAELSPKAINGLLRGQLGYDGVVITDGLYMEGISNSWTVSQAAVMAIQAGNDLIEGPYTVAQVADVLAALKQAISQGKLTTARIDQSVQRILLMKMAYGIIK